MPSPSVLWRYATFDAVPSRTFSRATDTSISFCDPLSPARSREETWVNFKLFGMMGLTLACMVAQAFHLARHISDPADPEETN